jgi:hypothetical protein
MLSGGNFPQREHLTHTLIILFAIILLVSAAAPGNEGFVRVIDT